MLCRDRRRGSSGRREPLRHGRGCTQGRACYLGRVSPPHATAFGSVTQPTLGAGHSIVRYDSAVPSVRKAVFPAAGLGTRFLPATKAQPKEMLPLVDKPIIQY